MENSIVDVSTQVTHHPFDTQLVMVQVSAYSTSWATHEASHATMGSSERCSALTLRHRCAVELCYMNVTQIYDVWYKPQPYCPMSLELLQNITKPHAKMYPHTDDTLRRRILYALCKCLYVVVQVQHDNRHHDKNQHEQAYPDTL